MKRAWTIGINGSRMPFILLLIASIIAGGITVVQPLFTGLVLDAVASGARIAPLVAAIVAAFLLDSAFHLVIAVLSGRLGERFIYNLRVHSARAAIASNSADRSSVELGDLHTRIVGDTAMANEPFIGTIPRAVSAAVLAIGCIVGMAVLFPTLFLSLVGVIALTGLLAYLLGRQVKGRLTLNREDTANYSGAVWNLLGRIPYLKSRNAQRWGLNRLAGYADKTRDSGVQVDIASSLIMPVLNIGTQLCVVISIAVVSLATIKGDLTLGAGTMFVMFLLYSISPLVELGMVIVSWNAGKASVERLGQIWDLTPERLDGAQSLTSETPALGFEGVTYTFPGSDLPVIDNLFMQVEGPGIHVLRGANGEGKSTLLSIANGLVQPQAGSVTLNGEDTATLNLDFWRANVLLVDQDREPIPGTIRDNLGAGLLEVDDTDRMHAIEKSGVDRHLVHFTDGLDTRVGTDGVQLSGGQRALLALADAFLRQPQVLLLDEITAGIDEETLPIIKDRLGKYAQEHLVIAVSHDDVLTSIATREIRLHDLQVSVN